MFSAGDVVVATIRFEKGGEAKHRMVLVLFEDYTNVVVAGVTSNPYARGINITKKEGAPKDCTIKLNQLFTLDRETLSAPLFRLSKEKKKEVFARLTKLLGDLNV